jgi:outer membrane protein OmpA-like peptidoglycan-associated protein
VKAIFIIAAMLSACLARSQTFTVHFDFNKYELDKNAKSLIDSFLVAEKEKLATGRIELSGHCDFIGSGHYNDTLSLRRVLTVKKFLETNYPGYGKIVAATGYGKRRPLNENKTEEDRMMNRRVEIMIIQESLQQKIADTTIKTGSSIILRNIDFVGGRHHPVPESKPMLDELLAAMRKYPKLVIEIQGHICCQQGDDDGLDLETGENNLSEARAKMIADWLIYMGIEPNRLSYKGFGHSKPIYPYPEKTDEESLQNRRVEIKIISK